MQLNFDFLQNIPAAKSHKLYLCQMRRPIFCLFEIYKFITIDAGCPTMLCAFLFFLFLGFLGVWDCVLGIFRQSISGGCWVESALRGLGC